MSILIAAICISASLTMIVLGVRNGKWLLALPGPFGIWYGIRWVRVALEGYIPGGRLRLNPWGTNMIYPLPGGLEAQIGTARFGLSGIPAGVIV